MAGTSTDSNAAEQSGEKSGHKKPSKRSSLLSKLPRLATLLGKKTDETVTPLSQPGATCQDGGTAIGKAVAKSGEMLAKVVSNDTGYQAGTEDLACHEPGVICASPGPMSAASEPSSAPWSNISSGNNTAITTPGSSIDPKGKLPSRPGVLPDASPQNGSFSSNSRPSTVRSMTWSALGEVRIPSQDSGGDKFESSETNLIDGEALNKVVTFDKNTRFAPSNHCSSVKFSESPGTRQSITLWSEDPNWKLSERAQAHQKAVLAADPDTLPVVAKVKSAPDKGSSKILVPRKERVSSPGKNFESNGQKEAMGMTGNTNAENPIGKLKSAVPLPQEPVPKPELAPIGDPGYDNWTELGKDQKVKQRRELVSGISSYNWSAAQRHRTQPMAERMPIGPGGETAFSDTEDINDRQEVPSQNYGNSGKLNTVAFTNTIHTGGVSPRTTPAMLPAVAAVEEEEEKEVPESSSSSSSSASSSQNNTTETPQNPKSSKPSLGTTPNDSARPSEHQHHISHPPSGSIDLDLLESKLVKAGSYEVKLTSSSRSSDTFGGKVEMYRSHESGEGECRNGFRSCEMKNKSWAGGGE